MSRGDSTVSSRRLSYSEGAQVRGDRTRRVAVPLPSRLQELESHATRHFGMDRSTVRLHHRGGTKLEGDEHVSILHPGDLVVAHGSKPRGAPLSTTHKTDFQPHRFEPPARAPARPLPKPVAFTGRSHCHESYPPHEIQPTPRQTPRGPPKPLPFEGSSTYQSHYPGHPVERAAPAWPREARPPLRFEGTSTYHDAYPVHKLERPATAPPRSAPPRVPFDGNSTYHSDFPGHKVEITPRPASRQRPPPLPFAGNSEYQCSYVEKKMSVPKYLFIEPAFAD